MQIYIPGVPLPRARMRHYTRNGANGVWDPQRVDIIRLSLIVKSACVGHEPITCPVRTIVTFAVPFPKSMSKKKRLKALPSKKPDIDNYLITLFNLGTGRVWVDDGQIVCTFARKIYSDTPYTLLEVECMDSECAVHAKSDSRSEFSIPWQSSKDFLPIGSDLSGFEIKKV